MLSRERREGRFPGRRAGELIVTNSLRVIGGGRGCGGKVLAIFFPIMAFVAMGFDHVVANMFFLPAAIFADVPGITWADALHNWLFAPADEEKGAGDVERDGNGRVGRDGQPAKESQAVS